MAGREPEPRRGARPHSPEGGNRHAERRPRTASELVAAVLEASRGHAAIRTTLPPGQSIRFRSQESTSYHGEQEFGDQFPDLVESGFLNRVRTSQPDLKQPDAEQPAVEVVAFTPATRITYVYETSIEAGGLLRRPKQVQREVRGPDEQIMVTNPITGEQEPAVKFEYQFNPRTDWIGGSSKDTEKLGIPAYRETAGPRNGNFLHVQALLPASLAQELQTALQGDPATGIEPDPLIVRDIVKEVTIKHGGVSPELWEKGHPNVKHPVSPPYEQLPENWKIHIAEQPKDTPEQYTVDLRAIDTPAISTRRKDERAGASSTDNRQDTTAAASGGSSDGDDGREVTPKVVEEKPDPITNATQLYLDRNGIVNPTADEIAKTREYIEACAAHVQQRFEAGLAKQVQEQLEMMGKDAETATAIEKTYAEKIVTRQSIAKHNDALETEGITLDAVGITFVEAMLQDPIRIAEQLPSAHGANTIIGEILETSVTGALPISDIERPEYSDASRIVSQQDTSPQPEQNATDTTSVESGTADTNGTNTSAALAGGEASSDTTESTEGADTETAGAQDTSANPSATPEAVDNEVPLGEKAKVIVEPDTVNGTATALDTTTFAEKVLQAKGKKEIAPDILSAEAQRLESILAEGRETVAGQIEASVADKLAKVPDSTDADRATAKSEVQEHLLGFYSKLAGQEITNLQDIPQVLMAATIADPEGILRNTEKHFPLSEQTKALHDSVRFTVEQTIGRPISRTAVIQGERSVVAPDSQSPSTNATQSEEKNTNPEPHPYTKFAEKNGSIEFDDLTPEEIVETAFAVLDMVTESADPAQKEERLKAAAAIAQFYGVPTENLIERLTETHTGELSVHQLEAGLAIIDAFANLRADDFIANENYPSIQKKDDVMDVPDVDPLRDFVEGQLEARREAIAQLAGEHQFPEKIWTMMHEGVNPEIIRMNDKVVVIAQNGEGQTVDVAVIQSVADERGLVIKQNVQTEVIRTPSGPVYLIHEQTGTGEKITYRIAQDGTTDIFPRGTVAKRQQAEVAVEAPVDPEKVRQSWKEILIKIKTQIKLGGVSEDRFKVEGTQVETVSVDGKMRGAIITPEDGDPIQLDNVKTRLSTINGTLQFVDLDTNEPVGAITLSGRYAPIEKLPAKPASTAVVSPREAELEARLRALEAQMTVLANQNAVMTRESTPGQTLELPAADRDVPRAPERATELYKGVRRVIAGEVVRGQYPHPTLVDDIRTKLHRAAEELKTMERVRTGEDPSVYRGWMTTYDMKKAGLFGDNYPGNKENAGRRTLGERDGRIVRGPKHRGATIVARSGVGKTNELLKPMVADEQGLVVVEAPPDLMRDTFDARLQWGPNQLLSLSPLYGAMRQRFGAYAVTYPIIEEFRTYDGAVRMVHDLSHDQKKGKDAGGDSHATYWGPLGEALGASLGHAVYLAGDDWPQYLEKLRMLNVGLQYNESGQEAPPKVRMEVDNLFGHTADRLRGAMVQVEASIAELNAKLRTQAPKDEADMAAMGAAFDRLQAEKDNLEQAQFGVTLAQQEFSAFGALHPKTASTVASVARTILSPFRTKHIQETLSRSDSQLDPTDLTPHTVYVNVSDKEAALYGKVQRAVHNRLTGEVKDRYAATLTALEPGAHFVVDEGGVTELTELAGDIITMRKMGAATTVAGQTAGMLIRSMGEEAVEAMLANNEVLIGSGADPKAVEIVSKQLGTHPVWERKERFSWWDRSRVNPDNWGEKGGARRRERVNITKKETKEDKPKLDINDVVNLKDGSWIHVHDGKQIGLLQGRPYHKDTEAKNIPKAPVVPPDATVRATAQVIKPTLPEISAGPQQPAITGGEAPLEIGAPDVDEEAKTQQDVLEKYDPPKQGQDLGKNAPTIDE